MIAAGEAFGVDTVRVLLDAEAEGNLPAGEERLSRCRHMLSSASLSMPAKYLRSAEGLGCCGQQALGWAAFMSAVSCGTVQDEFHLTIDD